jgi:hypothetical protein
MARDKYVNTKIKRTYLSPLLPNLSQEFLRSMIGADCCDDASDVTADIVVVFVRSCVRSMTSKLLPIGVIRNFPIIIFRFLINRNQSINESKTLHDDDVYWLCVMSP